MDLRLAKWFPGRSSRSCLVNSLWRLHMPRTPPEETRMSSGTGSDDAQRALGGRLQRMGQDRLLDLLGHPVEVRPPSAGKAVDQPLGLLGPVVALDLGKLLVRIPGGPSRPVPAPSRAR